MKICCEEKRPIMVFVYDGGSYKSYSCCISSRKQDGTYVKTYVPLLFANGSHLKDRSLIDIKDGFTVALVSKDGARLGFYVRDFEVVTNEE